MVLSIHSAMQAELPAVWRFYEEVCAAQKGSAYSPGWHIGVYPDRDELSAHIAAGEVLLAECEGRIAAAGVLTGRDDPLYADAAWRHPAAPEDVSVLHLFALHPDFRGQRLAGAVLERLAERAERNGKRYLRLDVVKGNLPAERLYQKHGFVFCEERDLYYEDTGEITVRLYERELG